MTRFFFFFLRSPFDMKSTRSQALLGRELIDSHYPSPRQFGDTPWETERSLPALRGQHCLLRRVNRALLSQGSCVGILTVCCLVRIRAKYSLIKFRFRVICLSSVSNFYPAFLFPFWLIYVSVCVLLLCLPRSKPKALCKYQSSHCKKIIDFPPQPWR